MPIPRSFSLPRFAGQISFVSPIFLLAASLGRTGKLHAQLPAQASAAPHELNAAEKARVEDIVHRMTPEEKLAYIGGTGFSVRAMPSLQLPELMMSDGPYGVRSNSGLQASLWVSGTQVYLPRNSSGTCCRWPDANTVTWIQSAFGGG